MKLLRIGRMEGKEGWKRGFPTFHPSDFTSKHTDFAFILTQCPYLHHLFLDFLAIFGIVLIEVAHGWDYLILNRTLIESIMPEFITSPIFLIIAAVLALFVIIGIVKHTVRFLIWIAIIAAILIWIGVIQVPEIREWFERLPKW